VRLGQTPSGSPGGDSSSVLGICARDRGRCREVFSWNEHCFGPSTQLAMGKIEELMQELRGTYSIVIVTHNMPASRARERTYTAFMYLGRLIEYGPTSDIFLNPHLSETGDYVTGRFG